MRRGPLELVRTITRRPLKRTTPILMYHHIRHAEASDKLSVSPESFVRQMIHLKKRGYRVISLTDIARAAQSGQFWQPRTVALTFDDGFSNFYDHAYPVLRKLGFQATVFIITSCVGRPGFLSWDQIRTLAGSGIDFGSHTVSHRDLTGLKDEDLCRELVESKRVMKEKINREPAVFGYPLGRFNDRVQHAVRAAGYEAACATNPPGAASDNDLYALKRIKISPTSDRLWIFRWEISGYYQWFKEVRRQ